MILSTGSDAILRMSAEISFTNSTKAWKNLSVFGEDIFELLKINDKPFKTLGH
jgi:hypothetical protein